MEALGPGVGAGEHASAYTTGPRRCAGSPRRQGPYQSGSKRQVGGGMDIAVGAAAELEADGLFRQLAKMYPAQPVIYRNWANLEFDRGLQEEGYRLFDVIEALVPRIPDTYVDRIQVARRLGDTPQVQATYARAKARLDPLDFLKIETVAQEQRSP